MATFSNDGKIKKRLDYSSNFGKAEPPILGYNPTVEMDHTTSSPFLLTITETTPRVILRTVIEYDKVYPKGNVVKIYPQEVVQLDPLPDRN